MNLRQLQYFYDAAQTENLAAVAQKHMVPASAVSSSIKRLEEELGTELFDRTANRITLNSNGERFSLALGRVLTDLEEATNQIRHPADLPQKLRILVQVRPKWIAELIMEYMTRKPAVEFIISNDYTLEDFRNFDLVISEQSNKFRGWQSFLLSVELICVKAAQGNELGGKSLRFRQLREYGFILPSKGNGMRDRYERLCRENGFQPNVVIECNDRQLLQYYVQSGLGLSIGAYRALRDNTQDGIIPLTVVDFNETQNVCVYYRESVPDNPAVKEFRDFLFSKRYG